MENGKLALILPTYRNDATARYCIETAANMASDQIDVFIGDNSENHEKWAMLRNIGSRSPHCHVFCHEKNLGPGDNWVFLMGKQDHEYVCLLSDDDVFSPDYFLAGLERLKSDPDCAAASGLFLSLSRSGDQFRFEMASSYEEATPVERIWSFANHPGFNATNYAVHRRAAIAGFEAFMRDRPYYPAYMDQFQTMTLLSQGTRVLELDRKIFIYNNHNWSSREALDSANASYFVNSGLPEYFKHFQVMCWAVDAVLYYNSIYCPHNLSDQERSKISAILHLRLMKQIFIPYLSSNLELVTELIASKPGAVNILRDIVETNSDDVVRLMNLFADFMSLFNKELGESYRQFAIGGLRPAKAFI